MTTPLDDHGQPLNRAYFDRRVADRAVQEMLGVVKCLVADGVVDNGEMAFFRGWLRANPQALTQWPGDILSRRIERIFADGRIDEDEREDLYQLMHQAVGAQTPSTANENLSTRLPLDDPPPPIIWPNRRFVVTGAFVYGPRRLVQQEITQRGGQCAGGLSRKIDYLIVGTIGSEAWIQSTHGRKIEAAIELRNVGVPIAIIGEEAWTGAL